MIEIERKFLVDASLVPNLSSFESKEFKQGYFCSSEKNTIRIRLADEKAFLTIKGKTEGISRSEFEYEVPHDEGIEMLPLCGNNIVEKTRHFIPQGHHTWELDFFKGKLDGLILAEIELNAEDEKIDLPPWINEEVSHDSRYFNSNLSAISDAEAKSLISA